MGEPGASVRAGDPWTSGSGYESYVGRWSRLVAGEFVDWLAIGPGSTWVDVGCGTGALSETILAHADPASIVGVDPSSGFIAHAREHVIDPRASFTVGDAARLPLDDGAVDAAVAGLVLNFVPDPIAMLAEMRRVTRPGGTVGAYVWDYAGEMQLMRAFWDAAIELDPGARDKDEGVRFPICAPDPLRAAYETARLQDIDIRPIDVATVFRDLDDYWTPFLSETAPAPAYAMSLSDTARQALRTRIAERLPIAADGTIRLIARAWAVRATPRRRADGPTGRISGGSGALR